MPATPPMTHDAYVTRTPPFFFLREIPARTTKNRKTEWKARINRGKIACRTEMAPMPCTVPPGCIAELSANEERPHSRLEAFPSRGAWYDNALKVRMRLSLSLSASEFFCVENKKQLDRMSVGQPAFFFIRFKDKALYAREFAKIPTYRPKVVCREKSMRKFFAD